VLNAWCVYGVIINVVLGMFNLLPVPPLDGGRIVTGLLPGPLAYQYMKLERFGFFIVIILIYYNVPQIVLSPVIQWVAERLV
ncbi:MAG: site-2 protease family protein, partial [Bdellovibrionales bacterium]|nr:site-2 protease family protein [Bdellovibrionales bacterium]